MGLQPHSKVTPLFSMGTGPLASLKSYRIVNFDAWCKWGLEAVHTEGLRLRSNIGVNES